LLYDYLLEHGVARGRSDRSTLNPVLEAIAQVESQIERLSKTLALTPASAADLGLSLKRLESSDRFDMSRLDADERQTLERLLAKASTNG
jgi:phage terminase small subunit